MAPAQDALLGPAKNQPHRCTGVYRAGRQGRKVIISIAPIKNLNALIKEAGAPVEARRNAAGC